MVSLSRIGRRISAATYFVFMGITSFVIASILNVTGFPLISTFLALFLLGLCLYPAIQHQVEEKREFPAIAIMAGAFAIQYSLPVFLRERVLELALGTVTISDDSLVIALLLAIVGVATFLITCGSRPVVAVVDHLPIAKLHLKRSRALIFSLLTGLIPLFGGAIVQQLSGELQTQYGAVFKVLQNQTLVGIGILVWLVHHSEGVGVRVLLYVVVGIAVAVGIAGGSIEAVLLPLGVLFASQWIFGQSINKWLLFGLVAAALFLNPVKGDFRTEAWYGASTEASSAEKIGLWVGDAAAYWYDVAFGSRVASDAATQLVSRVDLIDLLAHVVDSTPGSTPYFEGDTYSFFFYAFIPRFLWPEKPVGAANRTLAVAYGLTTEEGAERSTFGIGLLGEGYANFGWRGVVLMSFLLAVVLLVMQRLLGTADSGSGGPAILVAFFAYFVNGLGSSAEILFANVLQSVLLSYVLLYWVTEKRIARLAKQPRSRITPS